MSSALGKKPKRINRSKTTVITDPLTYVEEPERLTNALIFDAPVFAEMEGSPPVHTWRINMGIVNPLTDEGDLVLQLDRSFCFSVQEGRSKETGALTGYSCAIPLWDRDGATPRQLATSTIVTAIAEKCKDHLLSDETMGLIGKFSKDGLERAELKKFGGLYWKKDKGKIVEGTGPTWYPKLAWNKPRKIKKKQKVEGEEKEVEIMLPANMTTVFYDEDEVDEQGKPKELDPLDFLNKKFFITPLVKIEGIFIGATISLQCKIYEADAKMSESGVRRMLHVAPTNRPMLSIGGVNPMLAKSSNTNDKKSDDKSDSSKNGKDEVKDNKGDLLISENEDDLKNKDPEKKEEKKGVVRRKVTPVTSK